MLYYISKRAIDGHHLTLPARKRRAVTFNLGEYAPQNTQCTARLSPVRCNFYIFRLSTPFRISNRNAMKLFMYGINSPESIIDMTSSSVTQRASMTSSA